MQAVHRNERTLSVQRMKMFEAELRVWQRKGEAIVKLMETVGHDKDMWEIINKQSRLHGREVWRNQFCRLHWSPYTRIAIFLSFQRDRIREEYDIL